MCVYIYQLHKTCATTIITVCSNKGNSKPTKYIISLTQMPFLSLRLNFFITYTGQDVRSSSRNNCSKSCKLLNPQIAWGITFYAICFLFDVYEWEFFAGHNSCLVQVDTCNHAPGSSYALVSCGKCRRTRWGSVSYWDHWLIDTIFYFFWAQNAVLISRLMVIVDVILLTSSHADTSNIDQMLRSTNLFSSLLM